ncbi:16S rRNA (uracil(1498)-N(3))-methyltransferase [Sphaerotilaceae bacterium SBD11-9]
MPARLYIEHPLAASTSFSLPPGPARHVQVLRLQPGAEITLFNGQGGEWRATVQQMGRSEVLVQVHEHDAAERELAQAITLAVGMPANERMDALVEKATELGVAAIHPLTTERSVLRLSGERAERRQAHWQGVAIAASEQCGRTRVPVVAPVRTLTEWLRSLPPAGGEQRCLLSPRATQPLAAPERAVLFLSGPEGGLSDGEEAQALQAGFAPVSLGPRVLRADTAPLAVLAHLALASL